MQFTELPLMTPALFKHKGVAQSDIFEIMKLGYSKNEKAVYLRIGIGLPGQNMHMQHYWRECATCNERYEFIDFVA